MRSLYLLILSIGFVLPSFAQTDPIVVQTLTFDSITTRRGWFQFPDDSQPWRKILMLHTLKCDPATTADGYDCGEWDYLTYNIVYDHTGKQDSTTFNHPYFLAGLAAPPVLDLQQVPLYDRYVEDTGVPQLVQSTNVQTATIQPVQNENVVIPLEADVPAARLQMMFTRSELLAAGLKAGPIHELVWNELSSGTGFHLTVRLAPFLFDDLLGPNEADWVTVLSRPWSHAGGMQQVLFSTPFVWDGIENILVDIAISRAPAATVFSLQGGDKPLNRAYLFDGPDGYLDLRGDAYLTLPTEPMEQVSNEITIAFWSKGADSQPENNSILEALDSLGRRVLNIHLPWSNGQIYWDAGNANGTDRINRVAGSEDFKEYWTHWTFVKNATTKQMKIYRNGELWHSGGNLSRQIKDIHQFVFGRGLSYNGPYRGSVDELMIFKKELDAATIAQLPIRRLQAGDAAMNDLLLRYDFNTQAATYTSQSAGGGTAVAFGRPVWTPFQATALRMGNDNPAPRPRLGFVQGDYTITVAEDTIHHLVPRPIAGLVTYDIIDRQPVALDTVHGWEASTTYVYDTDGSVLDSTLAGPATTWLNDTLIYYSDPFEVVDQYEIGRYITPYGIGLDLGPGFTWVYDVTDYAPILQDLVDLSAGNNQELIDLKFVFYPGTPAREVKKIDRLWGGLQSQSYNSLDQDISMAATTVALDPDAESFKVKTRITGHGHNSNDGSFPHCCEWKDNTHYLHVDGGEVAAWKVFQYNECALNPVFPQGGTWPGAREGWCPGDLVQEREFEITDYVSGSSVTLDYDITPVPLNNLGMGGGNYVLDFQLVQYGPFAHANDAEIYNILAPTIDPYYSRRNPVCHDPTIVLRNSGSNTMTSARIQYGVVGGTQQVFDWTGNLAPLEKVNVVLPVPNGGFWLGDGSNQFVAQVVEVNGGADVNAENNQMSSAFNLPKSYNNGIRFRLRTNNRPQENRVRVWDANGNIMLDQQNFAANQTMDFKMDYPDGCYTFELLDTANDGLSYWADGAAGQGYLRVLAPSIDAVLDYFESEFGRSIRFSFTLGKLTDVEEDKVSNAGMELMPNPAGVEVIVKLRGIAGEGLLRITDSWGRQVREQKVFVPVDQVISLESLVSGIYWISVEQEGEIMREKLVVQKR
ncbi:MAG: T9SS type A sorting domain-containing protein [Saprospiraceae bacterium]|nr:T9SS type A sorting domain-containing protein [Saprospiraceae bacterium]